MALKKDLKVYEYLVLHRSTIESRHVPTMPIDDGLISMTEFQSLAPLIPIKVVVINALLKNTKVLTLEIIPLLF